MPFLRTDLWRSVIVHAPMQDIVARGALEGMPVTLLPDIGWMRFLADPFGFWREGRLFVFAEAYDYRDRHGVIDVLECDASFRVVARRTVLREPWHLSYPVVFEAKGRIWMLPEASRSGRLSLYEACRFPDEWQICSAFDFPSAAIDASPVFHQGRWWMFYTPPGPKAVRQSVLCAAYADDLMGPWQQHPANPIWSDRSGARPGGSPLVVGDTIVLPTQDCRSTYGAAIRFLHLRIDPECVTCTPGYVIKPPAGLAPLSDGLHTVSAAGDVTLIDVKRVAIGPARHFLNMKRRVADMLEDKNA
ncbi:hypothetical protein NCH01_04770 [Neoasaia chiangmaiensis]|uniref:Glucosamine inositolphosphorylceramide transferase 1 N-terminal domain-containing protein n=1 Tax=Neoasaia chiangmaiensis TaxID=320497 RepID=A0A1U9KT61_9PROT|nr:hypothetical protein [Neoasaia chiangmaiensis]AQS89018.1 hypothetical protein A0U93_15065 [Neoasaia chiangmaiensis]GEN14046.1 hypothetical protein NCH01_04770 [Neoasaia chiangmaiensis]